MANAPQSPDSSPKGFAGLDAFVSDVSSEASAPIAESTASPKAPTEATDAGWHFSGRSLLGGAIGLLVVLALVVANTVDKRTSPASVATAPVSTGPAPSEEPPKQAAKFQFAGEFESEKALQALYDNYDSARRQSVWQMNAPPSRSAFRDWTGGGLASALQTEFFKEADGERALFVTRTVPDKNDKYECHACPVLVGAAIFYRSGDTWRILSRRDYLMVAGSWGTLKPGERVRIGPNAIGILFHDEDMQQGQQSASAFLIAPIDGKVRNLATIDTAADNEGNCVQPAQPCFKYTSQLNFVNGKNPRFYDLAVKYTGTDLNNGEIRTVDRTDVYIYANGQYERQADNTAMQSHSDVEDDSVSPTASSAAERGDLVHSMIVAATDDDDARVIAIKGQLEAIPRPSRGDRNRCRSLNKLGLELLGRASYANAVSAFESAVAADPADIEARENLGYANLVAERLPDAESALIATLVIAPTRASAWASLGRVYALRGDQQSAVGAFLNTIRFSKDQEKTFTFFETLRDHDASPEIRSAASTALASSGAGPSGSLPRVAKPGKGAV